MWINPFQRRSGPELLVVGMTGVRLGDRLAHIGCAHGGRFAAIAAKVGLSGRAVVVAPDEASAARATKAAARAGILIELEVASPVKLPLDEAAFDLAVLDETGGLFDELDPGQRRLAVRETLRVLRPGGRAVLIATAPRVGLGGLIARRPAGPSFDPIAALENDGFRSARRLATREGLTFFEAVRPRS